MSADLPSLIARVEKLEAPDREVDAAVWLVFFEPACQRLDVSFHTEHYDNDLCREAMECGLGWMWLDQMDPPLLAYTASLECCADLLRRAKPRRRVRVEVTPDGKGVASIYDAEDRELFISKAPTPALALLLALLRAVQATQETEA